MRPQTVCRRLAERFPAHKVAGLALVVAGVLAGPLARADQTLTFDGTVPPGGPELGAGALRVGDTVAARSAVLTARVTGGLGNSLRFVKNGIPEDAVDIDADPFIVNKDVTVPGDAATEDRWRVEVLVDNQPRTVSSHLYVRRDPSGADPVGDRAPQTAGCATSARKVSGGSQGLLFGLAAALAVWQWSRRSRRRRLTIGQAA